MPKKKYLEIEECLRALPVEFFDRSLVEIQADLTGFREDYPDHTKLRIMVEYASWDDRDEFYLKGTRSETDDERDWRLEQTREDRRKKAEAQARKEQAEREQLAKLLKKYGDG